MSREGRLYWNDILASCRKVVRYTQGYDFAAFQSDERTYDAVLRNLEIIGEAANRLPEELKTRAPEIEWARIASFRNVIAHAYFGIDDEIVWDVVQNKVSELLAALERAEQEEKEEDKEEKDEPPPGE